MGRGWLYVEPRDEEVSGQLGMLIWSVCGNVSVLV